MHILIVDAEVLSVANLFFYIQQNQCVSYFQCGERNECIYFEQSLTYLVFSWKDLGTMHYWHNLNEAV